MATAPLVAFEESHPDVCMRVRYEDLAGDPYPGDLFAFIGVEAPHAGLPGQDSLGEERPSTGPAYRVPFPADQVPTPLLTRADCLTRELGYESLTDLRPGPLSGA